MGVTGRTSFRRHFLIAKLLLSNLGKNFLACRGVSNRANTICRRLLRLGTFLRSGGSVATLSRFASVGGGDLTIHLRTRLLATSRRAARRLIVHALRRFDLAVQGRRVARARTNFRQVQRLFARVTRGEGTYTGGVDKRLRRTFAFVGRYFKSKRRAILFIAKLAQGDRTTTFVQRCNYSPCFTYDRGLLCQGRRGGLRRRYTSLLRV